MGSCARLRRAEFLGGVWQAENLIGMGMGMEIWRDVNGELVTQSVVCMVRWELGMECWIHWAGADDGCVSQEEQCSAAEPHKRSNSRTMEFVLFF
jgi:hypothetical protein